MRPKTLRITRAKAGLLVIDIQEKLLPLIHEKERLIQNSVRLIKAAEILSVPIFVTDAISSRDPHNSSVAVDRMSAAGAVNVTIEMALFEMLERAATDEFKQILALVR